MIENKYWNYWFSSTIRNFEPHFGQRCHHTAQLQIQNFHFGRLILEKSFVCESKSPKREAEAEKAEEIFEFDKRRRNKENAQNFLESKVNLEWENWLFFLIIFKWKVLYFRFLE